MDIQPIDGRLSSADELTAFDRSRINMDLHFKHCAIACFRFIETEFSFKCVSANERRVRYESASVFVDVLFDGSRSFELDIGIGQRNALYDGRERPFNIREVLRLKGVEDAENYTIFQASTQERLERAIQRLSELLKKHGTELLNGNVFAFKSIADLRVREGERYASERDLKQIRNEVQKAWANEDFAKVVTLYQLVEAHLTPSERKKLKYATSISDRHITLSQTAQADGSGPDQRISTELGYRSETS